MNVRRERALDVMPLSETWHNGDSVSIRRLRAEGLQVLERARPRTRSASLRVNHGGVAIAAVPGVCMSAVTLNGGQHVSSFEHLCARLVVRGSACIVSDVVEKTSTRRRSRIPCVVVEKHYDAST